MHVIAESDWRVAKDDPENDVIVYLRRLDNGLSEFKGVTHVKSTLSGCVALVRDTGSMHEWVERTIMAKSLHRASKTEVIAYNVSRMEFPFKSRDAIIHTSLEQDPDTLTVVIRGTALPDYDGPTSYDFRKNERKYTRIPELESTWQFRPLEDGVVEVTFQGYGDPGGSMSNAFFRWLISVIVWQAPYRTLINMQDYVTRDKYQETVFDYLLEPG